MEDKWWCEKGIIYVFLYLLILSTMDGDHSQKDLKIYNTTQHVFNWEVFQTLKCFFWGFFFFLLHMQYEVYCSLELVQQDTGGITMVTTTTLVRSSLYTNVLRAIHAMPYPFGPKLQLILSANTLASIPEDAQFHSKVAPKGFGSTK